jgi:DNA modification methylase
MSIKNTEPSYSNGHPCPKPIKIWEKILWRGSANESDIVYDPLLGSGTTAAAAETG